MADEQPIRQARLQVETNLNALTEVLQWFEQLTRPLLSFELWWQSQLILDEGFTNAVRHAHRFLPESMTIEIEVKVFANWLEIRIWDWGQPFNLEAKIQEIIKKNDPPMDKVGGRGLMFMKQLTDELRYTRLSDQRNCLIMRKRLS